MNANTQDDQNLNPGYQDRKTDAQASLPPHPSLYLRRLLFNLHISSFIYILLVIVVSYFSVSYGSLLKLWIWSVFLITGLLTLFVKLFILLVLRFESDASLSAADFIAVFNWLYFTTMLLTSWYHFFVCKVYSSNASTYFDASSSVSILLIGRQSPTWKTEVRIGLGSITVGVKSAWIIHEFINDCSAESKNPIETHAIL